MALLTSTCTICLQLTQTIQLNQEVPGRKNIFIKVKLQELIPEVNWLNDYNICEQCINNLMIASDFREQCLTVKSSIKEEQIFQNPQEFLEAENLNFDNDVKYDAFHEDNNDFYDYNEIKAIDNICGIFICYHCNKEHKIKEELIVHINKEHNKISPTFKYKRKEKCEKCGRTYVSVVKLRQHSLICDGITRHCKSKAEFQCDICLKFYTTVKILKAHKLKCKLDNLVQTNFKCEKCNRYYKNAKVLKLHETVGCKQEKIVSELVCNICGESIKTSVEMQEHLLKIHSLSQLHCRKCNIMFQTIRDYNTHKLDVHKKNDDQEKFNCELCFEKFKALRKIVDHYLVVHSLDKKSIKPYSCDICKKRFRKSTNLITHRLYHDGNRTNICSFCGKCFITKNDLAAHEHIHYSYRKYKCDKCDKAFKTNTTLRAHHLIVHTDPSLWKYVCMICKKRFPQKSNHDQHLRRHMGDKNFACPLCEKSFASKSEMQDHVKLHSDVRAFQCEYCGKDYRKRHTFNVHMTKIHGIGNTKIRIPEKKYPCHICPGKFSDKSKLARHLCTHSGVKPYTCMLCEKKFIDKSYLKHHVRTMHASEDVNVNNP